MFVSVNFFLTVTNSNIYFRAHFGLTRAMPLPSLRPAELRAGSSVRDITPLQPQFLFGYPHVPRESTGTHDPLLASALYLDDGASALLLISVDVIFVTKAQTDTIRRRIESATGMRADAILIGATHTHSGPVMVTMASNAGDAVVPPPDPRYLEYFLNQVVAAGCEAARQTEPALLGNTTLQVHGLGTNRHDPAGAADPEVPVLAVQSVATGRIIACTVLCAMHTTVLHEDSTLFSGDFAGLARNHLQSTAVDAACPILFFQGASGNQSPRHAIRGNSFAEAARLGQLLGNAVAHALRTMTFAPAAAVRCSRTEICLQPRSLPSPTEADRAAAAARAKFEQLRASAAARGEIRTAECDLFGAEETATLSRLEAQGQLAAWRDSCNPAEIQAIAIGSCRWIAWPGEFYVEYALELKRLFPGCQVITLANGELQGYIVTPAAAAARRYEAENAVFSSTNGATFLAESLALLEKLPRA
jgi:neutral ceramidase